MASSGALHQKSTRKFAEGSAKTIVGLHKTDVQLKKMMDSLEQQQNTAINNIANHQQAMKMSWRKLEEKRSASPQMRRDDKVKEDTKKGKRGMLLQSNTKIYTNMTPNAYNVDARPMTADDSVLGRTAPALDSQGFSSKTKPKQGPPPTQLTRAYTSPYLSSPLNFRKKETDPLRMQSTGDRDPGRKQSGSDGHLCVDDSQDFLSSSQPMLLKTNAFSKQALLKASNFMDMKSSSTGPGGFKSFYSDRPRTQGGDGMPLSPLASKQMQLEEVLAGEESPEEEDEVSGSDSMPTLAEQFEQIKSCKYIRHSKHYNPERVEKDEY